MAQRLTTALAIASDPPLLIADEPTTGLDRPLVDHTLDLLRRRCDTGAAVLLITHDLAAAERVADTVAVMYASRIVEHRPAPELFAAPAHPYTLGAARRPAGAGVPADPRPPADAHRPADRVRLRAPLPARHRGVHRRAGRTHRLPPPAPRHRGGGLMSLTAHGIRAGYRNRHVLDDVTITIAPGETLGLRGPSGSGKSTLVRVLALLHQPDAGHVTLDDTRIHGSRHQVPAALRTRIGVLFQSPRAASDPKLTLADLIAEPLRATRHPRDQTAARVTELADRVGLTSDLLTRRPHAVSDGQLQRACLARALAHQPRYLLCDEATTMLDASTQAHVAAVITEHQRHHDMGVLLVSHDTALMSRWADRVHDLPGPTGHPAPRERAITEAGQ